MERRWTNLPGSVSVTLEPVKSVLESLVDFLQGEPLPRATVDCQLDKGRIWIVGFFASGRVIENVQVDGLGSICEAEQFAKVIARIRDLVEGGLVVGHSWDLTGRRRMLVHDGLHRVPRGLVACGEGWGIFAQGRRGLVLGRRIISGQILFVRKRGS
jgi:hypothetical protein